MSESSPSRRGRRVEGGAAFALLLAAFSGLALWIYEPALDGPFVSDDRHYVATNPWVQELDRERLLEVLDPGGPAAVHVVNWAPVQILLHALAWQLFGDDVRGHHAVNVLLHALASALLVTLLGRSGAPRPAAALAGLLFLVHPANVEAVAWISQLKTTSAMVLALVALLLHPRRPGLASLCFGLALLAKGTAAVALPVAALLEWQRLGRLRAGWLALWALVLVTYLVPEFATHQRSGAVESPHPDLATAVRTICAIGLRYLVMAASSFGVSAFQETPAARSWLHPWWLCALPVLGVLGHRSLQALRGRRAESAWWVWAAVSFVPISQIFPFRYPMADRYLYFILPGLLGGLLFAGRDAFAALSPARRRALSRGAAVAALALALFFAGRAREQARIWRSGGTVLMNAALHYPDGISAQLLRARESARQGDRDAALAALRRAADRGFNRYRELLTDKRLAPLRKDPEFQALVQELAGRWIERLRAQTELTQLELRTLAQAHLVREERPQAIEALEQALLRPGPLNEQLKKELTQVRRGPPSNPLP